MKLLDKTLITAIILLLTLVTKAEMEVKLHISEGISDAALKTKIEINSSRLLSELGFAFDYGEKPVFDSISISPEAQVAILRIWERTSAFKCSVTEMERKCMHMADGGYQLRDIPIFMPEAEKIEKKQSLVLNFTQNGIIDEIFLIPENQNIGYMLNEGKTIKEITRRQRIIKFAEEFRTAYNTRDLDFLNMVFSDSALIITGKVIKTTKSDNAVNVPKERVEYVTQNKVQYLDKLAYIFKITKYLNVDFDQYEIQQHPKYPELYGLSFLQDWNTEYYKDKGYVFLMIDFSDEDHPIIHIRTWQPEKYNGEQLSTEKIFRITSFNFTR